MKLIRIKSCSTGIEYWINPLQIVSISGYSHIGSGKIKTKLEMSNGHTYAVDMTPEEMMVKLIV